MELFASLVLHWHPKDEFRGWGDAPNLIYISDSLDIGVLEG